MKLVNCFVHIFCFIARLGVQAKILDFPLPDRWCAALLSHLYELVNIFNLDCNFERHRAKSKLDFTQANSSLISSSFTPVTLTQLAFDLCWYK